MIHVKVIFVSSAFENLWLYLPQIPKNGDVLKFDEGALKQLNGENSLVQKFKIFRITWCIKSNEIVKNKAMTVEQPAIEFSHLEILVEPTNV